MGDGRPTYTNRPAKGELHDVGVAVAKRYYWMEEGRLTGKTLTDLRPNVDAAQVIETPRRLNWVIGKLVIRRFCTVRFLER